MTYNEIPEGWRVLGGDEVIARGDKYDDGKLCSCEDTVGMQVKAAKVRFCWIAKFITERPAIVAEPASPPNTLNVPSGWRLRGADEVIEDGDHYWKPGDVTPLYNSCCVNVGKTVSRAREWFNNPTTNVVTKIPTPEPVNYEKWFDTHVIDPNGDMLWGYAPTNMKLDYNMDAYYALGTGDVEMFDRVDGLWKPASLVSLHHQYRVKPAEPLVRWLTISVGGFEVYHTSPPAELGAGAKLIRLVEAPE